QAAQRFVKNILFATAFVADNFAPFDTDERSDIAKAAQFGRDFIRDELAIGEYLKIAVGVCGENLEQLRMHERLAAQNAEKGIACAPFRIIDHVVECGEIDHLAGRLDIDPAALAAKVAAIDDGEIDKRREIFAAFDAALEAF